MAPGGVFFAGDPNAIQDAAAAITDLAQVLSLGTLVIGESGLQLLHYGTSEARLTGALRTDGIIRGLGGLYAGAFTTTQRDAIASGFHPYGLVILNTTNNRLEVNLGSDATPNWQPFGSSLTKGTLAARPGAALTNQNSFYFATDDNGGTLYYSDGTAWTKIARGLTEAPVAHAASHARTGSDPIDLSTYNLSGTLAARPAAGTVAVGVRYLATDSNGGTSYQQIGGAWVQTAAGVTQPPPDGSVTQVKLAAGAAAGQSYSTTFPTSGLYNGYRHTIFLSNPAGGSNMYDAIYRADLDATYPWHVVGAPLFSEVVSAEPTSSTTYDVLGSAGPSITIPRAGVWQPEVGNWSQCSGSGTDQVFHSYDIGGTGASDADAVIAGVSAGGTIAQPSGSRPRTKTISVASAALVSKYRVGSGTSPSYIGNRWMRATPIRLI